MDAIEKLSKTHAEHISQYGTGIISLLSLSKCLDFIAMMALTSTAQV